MKHVLIENQTGQEFQYNYGVKQGDALSTILFNRDLHRAVKEIDKRGTIFTRLSPNICICR